MKLYPSVIEVDLAALRSNLSYAFAKLPAGCRLIAVVKANAYGHGAVQVAKTALACGAWGLAVANCDEAEALREHFPEAPILVLGPMMPCEMERLAAMNVMPSVFYPEQVLALQEAAVRLGKAAECHLALDTGMNRIGTRPGDGLAQMLSTFKACDRVKLTGMFSHLFHADGNEEATRMQKDRYFEAVRQVHEAGYDPMLHLANSAAALYGELHLDAVRLGIGMYGLTPWLEDGNLKPVMTWKTHVAYLHEAQAGETVSYGGTYTVEKPMRIATLPVGYADDYKRQFSAKAQVLIRGKRAPILGRICMDQCMVDVTDIPDAELGDEAVLLGAQGQDVISAQELADLCGTIHYEIVTGAGRRAPRVYVNE